VRTAADAAMAPAYRRFLRNPAALVAAALCMLTLDAW